MISIFVIVVFISILVGMAISVSAFGTGGKRAKMFENIYFSVEDVDGIGVVYTKKGDYSAILKMENPVRKYSADIDNYYDFTTLMASVMQLLGDGYAIHKQDIFVRKKFDMNRISSENKDSKKRFLSDAYFRFSMVEPIQRALLISLLHSEARVAVSKPTTLTNGETFS